MLLRGTVHKMPSDLLCRSLFLVVLNINYITSYVNFTVSRDEQDVFTNPLALGETGFPADCEVSNADCVDRDCRRCRCRRRRRTFVGTRGTNGECVENDKLVYVGHVKMVKCNEQDLGMLWVWTTTRRLMNMGTLKCLTVNKLNNNIITMSCSLGNQIQQQNILCEDEQLYDGYIFDLKIFNESFLWWSGSDLTVTNNVSKSWRNFTQVQEKVCKSYNECKKYKDYSVILILDEAACVKSKFLCRGSKEISSRWRRKECFILANQTQYLNENDKWENTSLGNMFSISVQSGKPFLQWDLGKASKESWSGMILKLQFSCSIQKSGEQVEQTNCVLVKFTGTIKGIQSCGKEQCNNAGKCHRSGGLIECKCFVGFEGERCERRKSKSSDKTVVISVTIVLLVLVLLLLVVFLMFHRRRKRSEQVRTNTQEIQIEALEVDEDIDKPELESPGYEFSYESSNEVTGTVSGHPSAVAQSTGDGYHDPGQIGVYQPLGDRQQHDERDYQRLIIGIQLTDGEPAADSEATGTTSGRPESVTQNMGGSYRDPGQTGIYQALGDRRQDDERIYQGLIGIQDRGDNEVTGTISSRPEAPGMEGDYQAPDQTGMYQALSDRRQEAVEGVYQGLMKTQVEDGELESGNYSKEMPNNPVSSDNVPSYSGNDNARSPSDSNNVDYIQCI